MTLTGSEGHDILMGRKIMAQLFTHQKLTSVSAILSGKLLFIGFGQGDYAAGRADMRGCNSQKTKTLAVNKNTTGTCHLELSRKYRL